MCTRNRASLLRSRCLRCSPQREFGVTSSVVTCAVWRESNGGGGRRDDVLLAAVRLLEHANGCCAAAHTCSFADSRRVSYHPVATSPTAPAPRAHTHDKWAPCAKGRARRWSSSRQKRRRALSSIVLPNLMKKMDDSDSVAAAEPSNEMSAVRATPQALHTGNYAGIR